VIGHVRRAHGVRGGVRARATGPTLATLAAGAAVRLAPPQGPPRRVTLAAPPGGAAPDLVLAFAEVATREEAAGLAGAEILVPAGALAPLEDPDTHYVRDLVGFAVEAGGAPLGRVADVIPAPANDVLRILGPSGEVLVPFTADAVVEVDRGARRLRVRPDLLEG
jgi:16S rRNA processing protein RimM